MSGICPEYVLKVYQNNNVHFQDIFRTFKCPEYVPKRDRFRTFILSGIHHRPGFLRTITLLDSLWTFSGQFLDIFGTYFFFRTFSGHFQAKIYHLTRARIYQLTQARIKNLYLMLVKFIHNAINIYNISSIYIKFKALLN